MSIKEKFNYYKKYGLMFIDGTTEMPMLNKYEELVKLLKRL